MFAGAVGVLDEYAILMQFGYTLSISLKLEESWSGWTENEECGVRSAECGVRSAECGVRKTRSMENMECGK